MRNIILEYVWLDGYSTANLRSKVKVIETSEVGTPAAGNLPVWNFDGSSTQQAPGSESECLLAPERVYKWLDNHYLVLCEVMNTDGSPHRTNTRASLRQMQRVAIDEQYWWGFEQEFFMTQNNRPVGFPKVGFPPPQGKYYCGVGTGQVVGRSLSTAHLLKCLDMGLKLTGTNAEVALGQWEYQCFNKDTLKACDDLWISRYVLYRMAEEYGFGINIEPKPVEGDWNGSGCHANFSTAWMRNGNKGRLGIINLMKSMEKYHPDHIRVYGENNDQRLTGDHETQHISKFSYGIGDRGASIRIPNDMRENNWKGYLEDRRPASNCDPYLVAKSIIQTVQES